MPELYHTFSKTDKEYMWVKTAVKVLLDEGWSPAQVNFLIEHAEFGSDMYWHCKKHPDVKDGLLSSLYDHLLDDNPDF